MWSFVRRIIVKDNSAIHIALLTGIYLLFLTPFLHTGIYGTHDGQLHIARIAAFYTALQEHQFPVRWAGALNYGYGTPIFIFYYPVPYVLGSLLHLIGFNFVGAFKALLISSFLLAPICFYYWMKKLFVPRIAFISALLYGIAPYHLLDLFVRGDIGELLAFIFIPLIFLSIDRINERRHLATLVGGIYYALLILSHNGMGLLFSPIFVLYALLKWKWDKKRWLSFVKLILIGLGLSCFFWLPAIVEQKYTHAEMFIGLKYVQNFPNVLQVIWSEWGFGTDVTKPGGLSPQIGPIYLLLVLFCILLSKRLKKTRWLFLFSIILFIISVFLSLPYSLYFWQHLHILSKLEFPWRFTAISSFSATILATLFLSTIKNKWAPVAIIGFVIASGISLIHVAPYKDYTDQYFLSYSHSTDFGAASTIWAAGDPTRDPNKKIETIAGDASIDKLKQNTSQLSFQTIANGNSKILLNTFYFPGWNVLVNNQKVPIEFQDTNHRGLITFDVPAGISTVLVLFNESTIRQISDIVTLTTVIFLCGVMLLFPPIID